MPVSEGLEKREDPAPDDALHKRVQKLRDEIESMEQSGELEAMTSRDLSALAARTFRAYSDLANVAFDDRYERGLYHTRAFTKPVDLVAIQEDYPYAIAFAGGEELPDGSVVEKIIEFPTEEYPLLNWAREKTAKLQRAAGIKRHGEKGR